MASVEKVTVSVPAELLARIEARRVRQGKTRSATVTELLWRGWHFAEQEERAALYEAAYAAQPESAAELAFTDAATADAFVAEGWVGAQGSTHAAGRGAGRPLAGTGHTPSQPTRKTAAAKKATQKVAKATKTRRATR